MYPTGRDVQFDPLRCRLQGFWARGLGGLRGYPQEDFHLLSLMNTIHCLSRRDIYDYSLFSGL